MFLISHCQSPTSIPRPSPPFPLSLDKQAAFPDGSADEVESLPLHLRLVGRGRPQHSQRRQHHRPGEHSLPDRPQAPTNRRRIRRRQVQNPSAR